MDREDDMRDGALSELDAKYYALVGDLAPSLLDLIRPNKDEIVLATSSDIDQR
jgi:hypothetical protein